MDVLQETNWYVIQTKPAREDLAAMNLRRMQLMVLLPKIRQEKPLWGQLQTVTRPLFRGYLFARFCPAQHLFSVRYARGVARVVGTDELPFPVAEELIQAIQDRLDHEGYAHLETKTLQSGKRVEIIDGHFKGLTGIFERELSDRKRIVILLEAIEYQARVILERRCVQAISQSA
jgi:transcriptional antiterminator RfaH